MSFAIGKDKRVTPVFLSNDGAHLAENLVAMFRDTQFLPLVYPRLFGCGIDEGSLHAYMLSALVLVGARLGFTPVSDAPIFDRLDNLLTGEGSKRPDAVWFSHNDQAIRCLVEFERYTHHSLLPKARNLLVMGKELQPPPHLIVLNYWSYSNIPESALQETKLAFARGFRHPAGVFFQPLSCPALVLETLVEAQHDGVRVREFAPRMYVHRGEDKPYIVRRLNAL